MKRARAAFSLLEILVVIALIGALLGLSATVYIKMMSGQQRKNTETSLDKLASQLRQAWTRVVEDARTETIPPAAAPAVLALAGGDPQRARVIWIKMRIRQQFPTNFAEVWQNYPTQPAICMSLPGYGYVMPAEPAYVRMLTAPPSGSYVAGNHKASTEMGACLYMALTAVGRRGASTEADVLSALDKRDSDNDGIMELVDGWHNPLGFFRWPYNAPPATPDFPAYPPAIQPLPPAGAFVDPEDPTGTLQAFSWRATPAYATFCTAVLGHTADNRAVYPLLVSAGPDGSLLLKAAPTSPVLYLGYGDLFMTPTLPPNYGLPTPPLAPPINDNIVVTTQK